MAKRETKSIELEPLGWSRFFADQARRLGRKDLTVARIVAEHRGRYEIWAERGPGMARRAGRLRYRASETIRDEQAQARPCVGDWVAVRWPKRSGDLASVEHIFTRRSAFLRRAAGPTTLPQVVSANVDTVFVVVGLDGDYNERRIERYVVQLADSGATPVVVLNKSDLVEDAEQRAQQLSEVLEISVFASSAIDGRGVQSLRSYAAAGQTVAFVGSSGVGKSHLVNALVGKSLQKVGAVRERDDRGQHTTRHRRLIQLPEGGLLLDTPGMRELQLWGASELEDAFEDIAGLALQCRFRDCRHESEPDCAVLEACDAGTVDTDRLAHYQQLSEEQQDQQKRLAEYARRRSSRALTRKVLADDRRDEEEHRAEQHAEEQQKQEKEDA